MTVLTVIFSLAIGAVLGAIWERASMLSTIRSLELAAKDARRFAGKLGDRIGRQRAENKKLKVQLKTLSTSVPAMAKPPMRPNLPH